MNEMKYELKVSKDELLNWYANNGYSFSAIQLKAFCVNDWALFTRIAGLSSSEKKVIDECFRKVEEFEEITDLKEM